MIKLVIFVVLFVTVVGFAIYQTMELETMKQYHEWAVELSKLSPEERQEIIERVYSQKQISI